MKKEIQQLFSEYAKLKGLSQEELQQLLVSFEEAPIEDQRQAVEQISQELQGQQQSPQIQQPQQQMMPQYAQMQPVRQQPMPTGFFAKYGTFVKMQNGGQADQMEQIMQVVMQMIQQGMSPEEIVQQLIQTGIPEEQAIQVVQMVVQQSGQQQTPMAKLGGCFECGGKVKKYQMGGQEDQMQQIMEAIAQMIQQGMQPEEIVQQLVQMGISEQEAVQMIEMIMQQMQQPQGQQAQQMPMAKYGKYQMGGQQADPMQEIMQVVMQMVQNGMQPEEIMQQLIEMGIPEEQAMQIIQMVMQQGQIPQAQMGMQTPDNNINPYGGGDSNGQISYSDSSWKHLKQNNALFKRAGFITDDQFKESKRAIRTSRLDNLGDPVAKITGGINSLTGAAATMFSSLDTNRTDSKGRDRIKVGAHTLSTGGQYTNAVKPFTDIAKKFGPVGQIVGTGVDTLAMVSGLFAGFNQAKTKQNFEKIKYGQEDFLERTKLTQNANDLGGGMQLTEFGGQAELRKKRILDMYRTYKNGGRV